MKKRVLFSVFMVSAFIAAGCNSIDDRGQLFACPVSGAALEIDRENKLRVA